MPKTKCHICGQKFEFEKQLLGKVLKCKNCGELLKLRDRNLEVPDDEVSVVSQPTPTKKPFQTNWRMIVGLAVFFGAWVLFDPWNWVNDAAEPTKAAKVEQLQEERPAKRVSHRKSKIRTTPTVTLPEPEPKGVVGEVESSRPQVYADTKLNYNSFCEIETGMSIDEVCNLIGRDGEINSTAELGGIRTVLISWRKEGILAGNCNVTFQNGKVVAKAQFGLN